TPLPLRLEPACVGRGGDGGPRARRRRRLLPAGHRTPTVRGGDTLAVVSRLPEDAPLPRADCVLRWSEGPEGTRWTLQLSSEDLSLVHRADSLAKSEYRVPAEVLAPLPAGTKLLWQVEARLPDGRVQRSATFVNRLQ
ncbi:hypothetical protein ACLESD_45640, partial [Pyxidicoccus sp. 3LFB2]